MAAKMFSNNVVIIVIAFVCCSAHESVTNSDEHYLLFDVSPEEGFNLRRDVYLRLARFAKTVNYTLVLPPWGPLPHWKASTVDLPWSDFFDVESLTEYTPVIEFNDFLDRFVGDVLIDNVYVLRHAPLTEHYEDLFYRVECDRTLGYERKNDRYVGQFFSRENVKARNVTCLEITGTGYAITSLFSTDRIIMIDHAEVLLHENFGDEEYWRIRSTMKFAQNLHEHAKNFIEENLKEKYLAVHLRRSDFPIVRANDVPSIKGAAQQVKKILQERKLRKVFLATDGERKEIEEFLRLVPEAVVFHMGEGVRFESSENLIENSSHDLCTNEGQTHGLSKGDNGDYRRQCSQNRGDLDKPCTSSEQCRRVYEKPQEGIEMEEKLLPPGGECANDNPSSDVSERMNDEWLSATCDQSGNSVDKPSLMEGLSCGSVDRSQPAAIEEEEKVLGTSHEKCENPNQEKGIQSTPPPSAQSTCTAAGRALDKPCQDNKCEGGSTPGVEDVEKQLAGKTLPKSVERATTEKPGLCETYDGTELDAMTCGGEKFCQNGDKKDYLEGQSIPRKHSELSEGQIAIVDQIICANAEMFVGSFESTFSFRIQEEREILAKSPDTTFNRLCADEEQKCSQPTKWTIVR